MAFKICYKFDSNTRKEILVATNYEAFQNTTVREIKEKISKGLLGKVGKACMCFISL